MALDSMREIFSRSGPGHLTSVDWNSIEHRRSVIASLVRGVSILELDRQQQRQGTQALAPPWWVFFQFEIHERLVDADGFFFGAVYENKCNDDCPNAPRYVVAFRGTIIKRDSWYRDLQLDLYCILHRLEHSSRFHIAMQAVHDTISKSGPSNVWLAGHSLGSAIALLAGKNAAKMGCPLETYLFNPPFVSASMEWTKHEKIKHGVLFMYSAIKAGVAVAVAQNNDSFSALSTWIPYLFVNRSDPICFGYIGYFEQREKMAEMRAGAIGRLATQHSLGCWLLGARGRDTEPIHLLPSAYLMINNSPSQCFKHDHGIRQWWGPDCHIQSRLHQFRTKEGPKLEYVVEGDVHAS